ncbi:MAG: hypothetical protein ACKONH_11230 [Planctomycetia bacterium]
MPGGVAGLLRPEFMASAATGDGRCWDLLEDAGADRWKIKTPLRAYHRASYVSAPLQMKPWFDSFVKPAAPYNRRSRFSAIRPGRMPQARPRMVRPTNLQKRREAEGFATSCLLVPLLARVA